jgi:inhibitor of KinA
VAAHAGLDSEAVVRLHTTTDHVVGMIGFAPGFPYLLGLPAALEVPRRPTPRTSVPAGSVAIAERQTGIYPRTSPGGWHVIGRTPQAMFDPRRSPPALLRAGDLVRFVPVAGPTRDEERSR